MRKIDKIIIHCSATPQGRNVTVEDIRSWHKARGFNDIGYHYVILLDGTVQKGRADSVVGAHCLGQNAHSIGVCYVGGCDKNMQPKDTRTAQQKAALEALVKELKGRYSAAVVYGHSHFDKGKACPSFDVGKEF